MFLPLSHVHIAVNLLLTDLNWKNKGFTCKTTSAGQT